MPPKKVHFESSVSNKGDTVIVEQTPSTIVIHGNIETLHVYNNAKVIINQHVNTLHAHDYARTEIHGNVGTSNGGVISFLPPSVPSTPHRQSARTRTQVFSGIIPTATTTTTSTNSSGESSSTFSTFLIGKHVAVLPSTPRPVPLTPTDPIFLAPVRKRQITSISPDIPTPQE
jgi:hypothetical protein